MVSSYQAMVKKREVEGVLMSLLDLGYADAGMPSLIIVHHFVTHIIEIQFSKIINMCGAMCV
jgi:hypothetical protein